MRLAWFAVGLALGAMVAASCAERTMREAIGDRYLACDTHDCGEDR